MESILSYRVCTGFQGQNSNPQTCTASLYPLSHLATPQKSLQINKFPSGKLEAQGCNKDVSIH